MSSLDTTAINSEVSFCKRARCVWGVWCRVCSKQDGISLQPHRRDSMSVFAVVKEPYLHRPKRALIAYTQKSPVYTGLFTKRESICTLYTVAIHCHTCAIMFFLGFVLLLSKTLTQICVLDHVCVCHDAFRCVP